MKFFTYIKRRNRGITLAAAALMALALGACMEDRSPTEPVEITRPELKSVEPAPGNLIVSASGSIKFYFSEAMNLGTFDGRFTLRDHNGNVVEAEVSMQDTVIVFTPAAPLQKSTLYYAELRGRVRDAHNNSIEVGGEPVLDDTTLLSSTWFYTEGDYSSGGYYPVFIRDRKEGSVRILSFLDSVVTTVSGFSAPEGMAVTGDGQYIVLSNTSKSEVVIINAVSGAVEAALKVPANPSSVVVSGNYAYVICVNGKALCRVNIASQSLEAAYTLKIYPGKLAVSPDGSTLYTFDQTTRDLYVINAADGSTVRKINGAVDKLVSGELSVDNATGVVYISDSKGYKVKTLEQGGSSLAVALLLPSGVEPVEAACNENYIYIAAGNSIYKYAKNDFTPVDTVTFTSNIKSVAIIPSNEIIYATLATSIAVIDEKTFTILKEKDLASSGIETITAGQTKR
jgi:hypothetical protein